jgi:murein DD-endopeptidase MepM/ murein hydrolase activator NlpD
MNPRVRVFAIAVVLFGALAALVWYLSASNSSRPVTPIPLPSPGSASETVTPSATATAPLPTPSAEASPQLTPTPAPFAAPSPSATPTPSAQVLPPASANSSGLVIPVAGVRPEQLQDTYSNARSEGRVHNAIDIMAARNTPVIAAADGRVVKLFNSAKGGITIYQLGTDEKTVYYYAHLERYADGLQEGRVLRRGETIAYVGDSGNATPGNCHLHFQVYTITDPKHFWDGANINPYTLLR